MMGAGIAYVVRAGGLGGRAQGRHAGGRGEGQGYSEGLVAKGVQRGRTTAEKGEALLDRITPTADSADLAGCDLVIEAVFESRR